MGKRPRAPKAQRQQKRERKQNLSRITRKLKVCSYCNLPKVIFRNVPRKGPQCEDCYRVEAGTSKNYKKKGKNHKKDGLPHLMHQADKLFSSYIRNRYMMDNDLTNCYTCGVPLTYADAQCGHFISRGNLSTRWLPENCRVQCHDCNVGKSGNLDIFAEFLERDTVGIVEKLQEMAKGTFKPTQSDLKEIIKDLQQKLQAFK